MMAEVLVGNDLSLRRNVIARSKRKVLKLRSGDSFYTCLSDTVGRRHEVRVTYHEQRNYRLAEAKPWQP